MLHSVSLTSPVDNENLVRVCLQDLFDASHLHSQLDEQARMFINRQASSHKHHDDHNEMDAHTASIHAVVNVCSWTVDSLFQLSCLQSLITQHTHKFNCSERCVVSVVVFLLVVVMITVGTLVTGWVCF